MKDKQTQFYEDNEQKAQLISPEIKAKIKALQGKRNEQN
jgi:hypothetical protein